MKNEKIRARAEHRLRPTGFALLPSTIQRVMRHGLGVEVLERVR